MKISKKTLRILGTLLIVLGITYCVGLILTQYTWCVQTWRTTFKAEEFATAFDFFLSRSKGLILIALCGGSMAVVPGILLLRKAAAGQ